MTLKEKEKYETTCEVSLERKMDWKEGFLLALGGPVLVLTAVGPIAAAMGSASILVWILTVVIGVIQTIIYADFCLMFPNKSGGFAVVASEIWEKYAKTKWIGVIISWGYWFGWSPVLAINLVIIGMYLNKLVLPGVSPLLIGGTLMVIQGILATFGIKVGARTQLALGVFAVVPLLAISIVPWFTGQIVFSNIWPIKPLSGHWEWAIVPLFLANAFAAAWCDYATETATVYTAEYKNPAKDTPKATFYSGAASILIYTLVPTALLGVLGLQAISDDPYVALVTAAQMLFGTAGSWIVAAMLISALLLSANTALYGCSRTLYQMALDGMTIKQFGKLNRFNEPGIAIAFNIALNIGLMFAGTPMFILVASSIGYLANVPIVQLGYFVLRSREPGRKRLFHIPDFFKYVALILVVWNIALVVFGSVSYGMKNFLVGMAIFLSCVPLYLIRHKIQNRGQVVPESYSVSD